MQQGTVENVESNASNNDLKIDRPRTRTYIKQETEEDSKVYLECALYSPVKIESSSSEISKYDSTSSKGVKNRRCSICDITFHNRRLYLDHELHSHKTKETPIIDLETFCCNICNKRYSSGFKYRRHMAKQNNIHIPLIKPHSKPNPSITPDFKDPNNYCISCNYTYKSRKDYYRHMVKIHHMQLPRFSSKPHRPKNMKPVIDLLNMYCDICNSTFGVKNVYIQHLVQVHEMTLPDLYSEPSNFDPEGLYCKMCDKRYKYKWDFTAHLRKIHNITSSPFDSIPNVDDQNNYCSACDKLFLSRKGYLLHLGHYHFRSQVFILSVSCNCFDYI
ncbi:hypothetical protein BDF21DRAFT_491499, partial [Thamnidium elegans]